MKNVDNLHIGWNNLVVIGGVVGSSLQHYNLHQHTENLSKSILNKTRVLLLINPANTIFKTH